MEELRDREDVSDVAWSESESLDSDSEEEDSPEDSESEDEELETRRRRRGLKEGAGSLGLRMVERRELDGLARRGGRVRLEEDGLVRRSPLLSSCASVEARCRRALKRRSLRRRSARLEPRWPLEAFVAAPVGADPRAWRPLAGARALDRALRLGARLGERVLLVLAVPWVRWSCRR